MRKYIDKLTTWLISFGADKYIHTLILILLSTSITAIISYFTDSKNIIIALLSAIISLILGILKEYYDKITTNLFDKTDLIFDIIGCICFLYIYFILI